MEMLIPAVNQALSFFEWLGSECLPGRGQCLQGDINPVILGWKFSLIHQHVRWCVAYTVTSLEVHYIHYMWMIKPLSSLKRSHTPGDRIGGRRRILVECSEAGFALGLRARR